MLPAPATTALREPRTVLDVLPPLALYVHIPWCVRKCPYCDFNSHEVHGELPERRYIEALAADLDAAVPLAGERSVDSVFFGGGTPSLLSAAGLEAILDRVRAHLTLSPQVEITLEANPGTVEAQRFAEYRALGVNRLSLGIQSFDPRHLVVLGRIHDAREARRAAQIARECFDNFNLDLMYALPRQTLEETQADVETALDLMPTHLSCYHLTIEPNTRFHHSPPPLPDDELAARMQEDLEGRLAQAGYSHYETSAFAQAGRECRHNLNYWRFGDYLGIGAGAHSKLSDAQGVFRQMRYKHPREYMDRALQGRAVQEQHAVAAEELAFEFMLNALRLTAGFPAPLFEARTGLPLAAVEAPLARAEALGLIERSREHVTPTRRGQRFLNDLLQLFLPG